MRSMTLADLAGKSAPAFDVRAAVDAIPRTYNFAADILDRNLAAGRSGKPVFIDPRGSWTYGQLAERVDRFGRALRSLGIRREERILLALLDTIDWPTAFLGAIRAGVVPIPVNTLMTEDDYRFMLADSRAKALVVSEALYPRFASLVGSSPDLVQVIVSGENARGHRSFEDLLARAQPETYTAPTTRDDICFWLYTSGSTGRPKGAVHVHASLRLTADLYARGVLALKESDLCYSVAKLFFAYGLGNALYMPFAVGATSILLSDPPTAPRVYDIIARHRPTLFFSVPTNYGMLLAHLPGQGEFDLSSVRHAVSAGEALPESLYRRFKDRFGVEILDAIGSTEALHMFIANRPGAVRPGSSGQLVPGYDARIVDDDDRPVADGELGNLLIKGDSTCAFYWNQHEKTKQTIQGEWLRTGDKYTRDADGYYWYAGRTDDMLKPGGIFVSPIEIESALIAHDDVLECAVVGREDNDGLVKPFAYVVLKTGTTGTPQLAEALQQFVRSRLPDYKRPRGVQFVSDLPKTATGKLQRFKLREAAEH
jgi:benzoate-CoA ligase